MILDLTAVETDLKNYTLTHREVMLKLANTIGFAGKPGKNIPVLPLSAIAEMMSTDGRNVMATLKGNDPIQRGQTGVFNPRNFGTMATRSFMSEPAKADEQFIDFEVQALYNTYLQRVKSGQFDPEEVPFMAELMTTKFANIEKFLRRGLYLGVKATVAGGGSSLDLIDGWIKQIADSILAGGTSDVKDVTMATLTATNALDEIELLYSAIPAEDFLTDDMVCHMTLADFRAYQKCFADKYKYVLKPDEYGNVDLHDTNNIKIAVEPSWTNKPMITPVNNFKAAIDFDLLTAVEAFYDKPTRTLKLMQDFKVGCGIAELDKVYQGV